MPNTHVRYWWDENLKKEIERIADKADRSASYIAEKFVRAGLAEFQANLPTATPGGGLKDKLREIKK